MTQNGLEEPDAGQSGRSLTQTTVALFDDAIDTEHALLALRKTHRDAERVSVVLRDREADMGGPAERHGALAHAIVAAALDAVGNWLHGLASLIVPGRGTFLVAGPLGATVAGTKANLDEPEPSRNPDDASPATSTVEPAANGLLRALMTFGFSQEEAAYLEHRVAAGARLVAVTSPDATYRQAARRHFAAHNAVHIGQARTDEQVMAAAVGLLVSSPELSNGGDVIVTDAIAPLRRFRQGHGKHTVLGHRVVDDNAEDIGTVAEVLAEVMTDPVSGEERQQIRYIVVGFGGLLGMGRHYAAVPAGFFNLDTNPVRVTISREILHQAPRHDSDLPLSRREEIVICGYFGTIPYWHDQ